MAEIELHVIGGKEGESIVLKLPDGEWGVIDCYTPSLSDPAANPTFALLQSRGVTRLRFLALTHAHRDHYRGMAGLLENFAVQEFWMFGALSTPELMEMLARLLQSQVEFWNNPTPDDAKDVDELIQLLDAVHARARKRTIRLMTYSLNTCLLESDVSGDFSVTAIGPSGRSTGAYHESIRNCFEVKNSRVLLREKLPNLDQNKASGAFIVEFGQTRIVLGGDMETDGWKDAVEYYGRQGRLASVVVKASHHGSTNGYSQNSWEHLSPNRTATAVITAYVKSSLPRVEGLRHIAAHVSQTLVTSRSCVPSALRTADAPLTLTTDSADALLALRAVFSALPALDKSRCQGICSFVFDDAGHFKVQCQGDAAVLAVT